jgi:hypothetical protein
MKVVITIKRSPFFYTLRIVLERRVPTRRGESNHDVSEAPSRP